MSEYVGYKGELEEVHNNIENLNEKILQVFKDENIIINDHINENPEGAFYYYDLEEKYTILGSKVYKIISNINLGDDLFYMTKEDNGRLKYVVSYYNGGCGLSEAIEHAYKNMENNHSK